jgi:hypothetical protein
MGLSRQPAWCDSPVTLESLARQSCHVGVAGVTSWGPRYTTLAPVNHRHQHDSSCRANACGAIVWYCHTSRAGATKRISFAKTFFLEIVLKFPGSHRCSCYHKSTRLSEIQSRENLPFPPRNISNCAFAESQWCLFIACGGYNLRYPRHEIWAAPSGTDQPTTSRLAAHDTAPYIPQGT